MSEVYRCPGLYSSRAELDEMCGCVVSIYPVLSWIKSIDVIVYKFTVHEICCSELRNSVKVEVAALGSPSQIVPTVSVDLSLIHI